MNREEKSLGECITSSRSFPRDSSPPKFDVSFYEFEGEMYVTADDYIKLLDKFLIEKDRTPRCVCGGRLCSTGPMAPDNRMPVYVCAACGSKYRRIIADDKAKEKKHE